MRQELLHRGLVRLEPDGEPVPAELWATQTTAVVFERTSNQVVGTLREISRGLTPDGRLTIEGRDGDTTGVWECVDPVIQGGAWLGVKVAFPDEPAWENATVAWSNYGVRVARNGATPRLLPGARTDVSGARQWIVTGETRILVDNGQGCVPCGGKRR